ncbi:NDP-hexose 2,3-dehydratase family protein [Leuconostoc mesenteroides]|uniref:NDP-hexose 2,3-dehydratase family protein n=1 Tax=Leuconostoc mesenteroides TaxID=1245 RepID=UPI00311F5BC2
MNSTKMFLKSWQCVEGNVNTYEEILSWIKEKIENTSVTVEESELSLSNQWLYDNINGTIHNKDNSFFSVIGVERVLNGELTNQQPMILQPEIGYLGIIIKEIDGVLNFLMQAKIEPGNINAVQISPTIQATKSNFTAKHGGKKPAYLDYFLNAHKYHVIYDQIQSEQSSRFYKKRNRNILIQVDDDVCLLDNFCWMTLGQIKKMMGENNIINMDTRTVLSGIPFVTTTTSNIDKRELKKYFTDKALAESVFEADPSKYLTRVFQKLNDFKMFNEIETSFKPLSKIKNWYVTDRGVYSRQKADFSVRQYQISIEGREITTWNQPLFVAEGIAELALLTRDHQGTKEFLVKLQPEIGTLDNVEYGPTIQWESTERGVPRDEVEKIYVDQLNREEGIVRKTLLSEEGGRFYHEQNLNVIMEIDDNKLRKLPENYIWVSYSTLNYIIQINNVLNIQLRNLISMINL